MRTLVDLGEPQMKALNDLAKQQSRSRASIIREAVDAYLATRRTTAASWDDAFGLWGDQTIDGLDYQKRMRDEW